MVAEAKQATKAISFTPQTYTHKKMSTSLEDGWEKDITQPNSLEDDDSEEKNENDPYTSLEAKTITRRGDQQRRRSSMKYIQDETIAAIASFTGNLRDLIIGSGLASIASAVVPCLCIVYVMIYAREYRTDKFFGSTAVFIPPILGNTTVVPFHFSGSKQYFAQSMGELPFMYAFREIAFWVMFWLCHFTRAVLMFRPSKAGCCLCVALTIVSTVISSVSILRELEYSAEHGEESDSHPMKGFLVLYIFIGPPFFFVAAYAFSINRDKERHVGLMKAFAVTFLALFFDSLVGLIYTRVILPYVFSSETSNLMRFVVRSGLQIIALNVGIEVAWIFSRYGVRKMGCDINDATFATFANTGIVVPFFSRMLQGSAETKTEAVLFEVSGTIAELFIADSLLKGKTPIRAKLEMFKKVFLKRDESYVKASQVIPKKIEETTKDFAEITGDPLEGTEFSLRRFCESCMIILTITEAMSLLVSSTFWLLMNANPGNPGSAAIPVSQTLFNFGVMAFGEFIVTDGAIAYVSNKFKKRYCVDLGVAWKEFLDKRRSALMAGLVMCWCFCSVPVLNFPTHMCYTSPTNDESNFALTSCPKPVNITEMTRVSSQYQDEWELYSDTMGGI